jgi:hypothetical protein
VAKRGKKSAFWAKSAESHEKKGVDLLLGAKKCKKLQKSAQEYEKNPDMLKTPRKEFGLREVTRQFS